MISDFKNKDEYDYFRKIIQKIKEVNFKGLLTLVEGLPISKREYLRTALQSHRINIGSSENQTVARKIVSVKSKKSGVDQQQFMRSDV